MRPFLNRGTQRRFPPRCNENTFQAIQSTSRSLEIYTKRCNKICTCSVILGELESFRNYKGIRNIFSEHFRCHLTYYEIENFFLIPFSITFLNPKILGFLFCTNNSLIWAVKCEKLNFRKSQGIYQKIVHEWNGYQEVFILLM